MLSIITPTIRKEGLWIVEKALQKQTYEDFEWLIGSPFDPEIPWATWVKDDFEGGFWTLNRIYNKLLKRARGELVISWQDFVYATPMALESFWMGYMDTQGSGCISGVGDQYNKLDAYSKPYNKVWLDPRKSNKSTNSFYECDFSDIEWNFCAIPRKALFNIGGFCEKLDQKGFGMDGYQVNERLNEIGYKFYLDKTNESYSFKHDRSSYGGEENWNKNNNLSNGEYEKIKQEFLEKKEWPKMNYL